MAAGNAPAKGGAEELSYAKRLAREKYSPQTVWE